MYINNTEFEIPPLRGQQYKNTTYSAVMAYPPTPPALGVKSRFFPFSGQQGLSNGAGQCLSSYSHVPVGLTVECNGMYPVCQVRGYQ